MEEISVLSNTAVIDDKTHGAGVDIGKKSQKRNGFSPAMVTLLAEGGINFLRYLKNLGISREANLVVLSSKHHYYYDENDMKSVRILINLKKLNLIKHLDVFLNSLVRILPPDSDFLGYFSDDKRAYVNGSLANRISSLISRLNNFLDSRPDRILDRREVTKLLEHNGFEVVNMTKMNGLTYFYSHNTRKPAEFKA
jgi:hypothetical protein